MYRIRRANLDDHDYSDGDDLLDLHRHCFTSGESIPDFSTDYWWLAYSGFEPVGFGGFCQSKSVDTGEALGYLCRSGVRTDHRGRGLQLRLIRVRERKARELGLQWVVTDTNDNMASANTLIKAGYRLYRPTSPWALKTSLYWKKEIQ